MSEKGDEGANPGRFDNIKEEQWLDATQFGIEDSWLKMEESAG